MTINGQVNGTQATVDASAVADRAALQAEIARLQALNERLNREAEEREERAEKALSFKVGEKGGVSVYGLAGFPVTLYGYQWYRLFMALDALKAFMVKNWDGIKFETKDGKPTPKRAAKVADYLGIEIKELDR